MKQHEQTMELSAGQHPVINKPELPAQLMVTSHPATPVTASTSEACHFDIEQLGRFNAVGIGPRGAGMVQTLSRSVQGISCHEVIYNPNGAHYEHLPLFLSTVLESDILFIVTAFDDEYCGEIARAVGHSARDAGVLTLALIHNDGVSCKSINELTEAVDTVFSIPDDSLTGMREPLLVQKSTRAEYSMHHMITAITRLINHRSFIGIDFTDIQLIMRKGSTGRLGVGVASGSTGGGYAAQHALKRLAAQGISTLDAKGVLAIAQGSPLFTMEVFKDVTRMIHDHLAEDAKIIVGFVTDDQLENNVRVSVMLVW